MRLAALLLTAMALATAGPAAAATPVFEVTPDTLRADSTGIWRASLRVRNTGDVGIYADSLHVEWHATDSEWGPAPREGVNPLTTLIRVMAPASGGDVTGIDWSSPADFERGTLTFKLLVHDARKTLYPLTMTVVIAGNDLYERFPRALVDVPGGGKVEVIHVPAEGVQPAPGLLYVPPAGVSARRTLRWAHQFSARGIAVSVVSLPGSGGSAGPSDRAGPASVAAVEAALARLARQPDVDGKRLAVWGLGDGGSTALLAAVKHPELQGVIAQNAEYDPWRAYRALSPADQEAFVRAVGRDSSSWRARSPGLVAGRITAPVLVLQAQSMGEGSIAAAHSFTVARADQNLPGESRIEGSADAANRRDGSRVAVDFLNRRLKRP